MIIIIAEKPDQGAKIAAPFPHKKKQGFIEVAPADLFPQGAIVTWAVGHLCELAEPEKYDSVYKKWSLGSLPIIPDKFKHQVIRSKSKQFTLIKSLITRSDLREIIIASDAGREGEYIVRILLQL
ncbi:MAG: topoisomerase, partial [Bacilli bacterium]|nr:topoisomerase [Bacilli bacterium]